MLIKLLVAEGQSHRTVVEAAEEDLRLEVEEAGDCVEQVVGEGVRQQ